MDYLIRCYLEHFNSLPRNSLHDRRKRQSAVEYISTLIVGYSEGQNANIHECVREAIISIIHYHEENRVANGSVCMMGKFHNILYVAVKLSFDWQLQDSATIATLLEHIYSCEKTFERILVGAIFGTKAPHYVAGWKSDFANQEENLRAMVFFIDHATNSELDFLYCDNPKKGQHEKTVRFIDLPIESCGRASALKVCVQLGLPDKVHILLRYGASIEDVDESTHLTLVEFLCNKLLEFCHCYPYNIVSCLQLIFRVTYKVGGLSKERLLEEYRDLIDDGILPLNRCGIQVPELKHLCRCRIREVLWNNYQLPNGIRSLNIPPAMQKYLDILDD